MAHYFLEQYFLTGIDRHSKYPAKEIVNNGSSPIAIKFMNTHTHTYIYMNIYIYIYIYNIGVPRIRRLDQARCLTGKNFEEYFSEKIIEPIYAPANDHRAMGLV